MKRETEEKVGLSSSFIVLLAIILHFDLVGIIFSLVLISLFLFRLSWKRRK